MAQSAKKFFTVTQQQAIQEAIVHAEQNTSGEIRVHLEDKCSGDPMQKALKVFAHLKMQETKLRNAVLFYLAIQDKKFAILGDEGVHAVVPENFWDSIKEHLQQQFKEGKFTEGLCEAVEKAGIQLKMHFPHKRDDVNELKDEVSFG